MRWLDVVYRIKKQSTVTVIWNKVLNCHVIHERHLENVSVTFISNILYLKVKNESININGLSLTLFSYIAGWVEGMKLFAEAILKCGSCPSVTKCNKSFSS